MGGAANTGTAKANRRRVFIVSIVVALIILHRDHRRGDTSRHFGSFLLKAPLCPVKTFTGAFGSNFFRYCSIAVHWNYPGMVTIQMVTESATTTFERLELDCGATLAPVDVAYETYGTLNADRTNAILVLHAFSGDAHAAGEGGWWSNMIGPGKAFDTDRHFVICSNVLGGCRGTTGPGSVNPETGLPWAMSFPAITISDMVRLQKLLIDYLEIPRLLTVSGGSMGGMQALEWAVAYPERVASAIPIACTARHSAQQIAFNEVGRQSIMADPDWCGGNYYGGKPPANGLALARMVGHITYMSDQSMREKFGRRLRTPDQFEVESYLKYRGYKFVDRFDANSYIYITKAMDDFDLTQRGALSTLFERARTRFLLISFSSDWLYPSYQSLEIVSALRSRNADVAYCNLEARYGHDSFLVEVEEQTELVRGFLNNTFKEEARALAATKGAPFKEHTPRA